MCVTVAQCVFSIHLAAQQAAPTAATNAIGPLIEFDSTVYDFHKIVAGQTVRHDFIFTNTGDAVLEISGVHPSCGCTTAGTWTQTVEPGKTGIIPLLFNSGRFSGQIAKTASVLCNDKLHPQVVLQLKGVIWRPIEVNPPTAVLSVVEGSPTNIPAIVTILNQQEEPITLSNPVVSTPALLAELHTVQPGKEFRLEVRTAGEIARNPVQGSITIKTSSTNMPSIEINALAYLQQAWIITPPEITLPPGPLQTAFLRSVSIRNNMAPSVSLSEPTISAGDVQAQLREIIPGHQFSVQANFPAGFQVPQNEPATLTVKTSDPKHPVLTVPIHQNLMPNPHQVGLPMLHRGPTPPVQPASPSSP